MTDFSKCRRIPTQKVVLYLDVYPGLEKKSAIAMANPGMKTDGITRYRVELMLPDWNELNEIAEAKAESEIFTRLRHPFLKKQYEELVSNNSATFDDEPDTITGSFSIANIDELTNVLEILGKDGGIRGRMELFVVVEDKAQGIYFEAYLSTDKPICGGTLRIDEKVLDSGIRKSAIEANRILGDALKICDESGGNNG